MFLGKNYIACLSPHPDDCEYAIAGTIRKFLDTEFHIYNISDGGRFDHSGGDIRKHEVESFWSSYENVKLFFVGEQYIRDIQNDLFIMKMEDILEDPYELILTPPYQDTHQDHRKINEIANSLTRSKKIGLVEYMTPSTTVEWSSNLYVDVSDYIEEKKNNLFKSFKSQMGKSYFTESVFSSYHTSYQTKKRGLDSVEFFNIKTVYS